MPDNKKQRRTVVIGIGAPVSATLIVERDVPDRDDPGDWEVVGVRRADCDLSPRMATECMTDDDRDELDRLAEQAPEEL